MNEARGGSKLLGRDHHPRAFTMWMAGGGIKPGITLGQTDDLGYNVVEDPVDVHDLHATILHLMGLDHTKLTYQLPGPRFPPHGRARQRREEAPGLSHRLHGIPDQNLHVSVYSVHSVAYNPAAIRSSFWRSIQ